MVYREESVGNNERVGQYSYIGDDGKTYTVKYSAGVNGFRSVIMMSRNILRECLDSYMPALSAIQTVFLISFFWNGINTQF